MKKRSLKKIRNLSYTQKVTSGPKRTFSKKLTFIETTDETQAAVPEKKNTTRRFLKENEKLEIYEHDQVVSYKPAPLNGLMFSFGNDFCQQQSPYPI
jgi:hypothetical protein